jgi:hypothetical protein
MLPRTDGGSSREGDDDVTLDALAADRVPLALSEYFEAGVSLLDWVRRVRLAGLLFALALSGFHGFTTPLLLLIPSLFPLLHPVPPRSLCRRSRS